MNQKSLIAHLLSFDRRIEFEQSAVEAQRAFLKKATIKCGCD
jgi:hypothetical protein